MRRLYPFFVFFVLIWTYGQNNVAGYEYWFDNNYNGKVLTAVPPVAQLTVNSWVATTGLPSGIHTFNFRSWDSKGKFSSTISSFFYKVPENAITARKVATYEYWFDGDYPTKVSQAANNQETFTLNTSVVPSSLANGIHTFNIRFKDNTGNFSSTLSSFFYKVPTNAISDRKVITYEYWFDGDYPTKVSQAANNQETFTLNTAVVPSSLVNGIHTFNIRFKDNTGNFSSTLSSFFYKNQNGYLSLKNIVAYEYWFNDDYNKAVIKAITPQQIANLNTFVIPENAGLGIGNHFMNIRFKDDSGLWSSIVTDEFNLNTLGIEDKATLENVVLYPNPTTKMVTVDLAMNYEDVKLALYDTYGRLLKQQSFENKKSLDFEMMDAAGVYLITISSENKQAVFRVIKK
jgi:Secretion system C-terminal sorting domain